MKQRRPKQKWRQEAGRRQYRRGLWAERSACLWLFLKGYHLLGHRVKTRQGEIDLIFRRGHTIAFVEVKARPTHAEARAALPPPMQRRILRAAQCWLSQNPSYMNGHILRFDLVCVNRFFFPQHLPQAFEGKES